MKKAITHLDWEQTLKDHENIYSIGTDFILMDKPTVPLEFSHPFRASSLNAYICTKGSTRGKINLKSYATEAPYMAVILPDQILEYEYMSDDFEAVFVVMSKSFLQSLNIEERFSAFTTVRENPYVSLGSNDLEAMLTYYGVMRKIITINDNPNKLEIARNLTRAFFYGAGYYFHKMDEEKLKNKNEILVDDYIKLVETHFKENHGLEFYANNLCLNPKYMSTVIKKSSGKTAGEWLNGRVILEAKALLKSTNMTIQQIADELNFSNQSFFGKYFKRLVGVSPKEYREKR